MKLFIEENELPFHEGFTAENDIFKRKPLGDTLTRIITNSTRPLTIAVEGKWGSGKTTFLKLWAGELKKSGIPVIFFDAFQADYHSDAFLPLVAEIVALANKDQSRATNDFVKNAKAMAKMLARSGIKIGVRAATAGALTDTDFANFASDIAAGASEAVDKHVSEIILGKEKEDAAREAFSLSLHKVVTKLGGDENKKPLIFIIDELDRSRPDFALSILEKIKHFFDVNQVHFVLGANLDQLKSTIKHTYGSETNADTYLEKFIHFTTTIIDDQDISGIYNSEAYARKLQLSLNLPNIDNGAADYAVKYIGQISAKKNLSLRSIERIMSNLAIAIASTSDRHIFRPVIAAGIAIVKSTNARIFQELVAGTARYEDVIIELAIDKEYDAHRYSDLNYARDEWRRHLGQLDGEEEERRMSSLYFNYNFSKRQDVVTHIANRFARPSLVRVGDTHKTPT